MIAQFTVFSYVVTAGVAVVAAFNVAGKAYDIIAYGHCKQRLSDKQWRLETERESKEMYEKWRREIDEMVEGNREVLEKLRLEKHANKAAHRE